MNIRIAFSLAAALLCGALEGPLTAAAVSAPTPDEQTALDDPAVFEAGMALAELDAYALLDDREAAAAALRHIAVLEPVLTVQDPQAKVALLYMKQFALLGLDRGDEADTLSKRMLRENPQNPLAYDARFVVAAIRTKPYDLLEMIETAGRGTLSETERSGISAVLSVDRVTPLLQFLYQQKDETGRYRLAEALLALGWDAGGDSGVVDIYRKLAIDARLGQGDAAAARTLLDEIESPAPLLELMVAKRYDPLFERGVDRVQLFSRALALEAARSGRDFNADPNNATARLRRIQYLRSVGENAKVLKLTDDYAQDISLVAETGDDAFWAINERAYSLLDLGRGDEAVALMEKLLQVDMSTHPDLISMSINHAIILNSAGRPSEAFAHAAKLAETAGSYTSGYGDMWIWSAAACALAADGRSAEAGPWLDKIKANRADNMAALTRTLVCLDRLDEAEAVVVERLSAEDSIEMIIVLQDYRDDGSQPATDFGKLMVARREALTARPAVVAALDKVGRVLTLPIVKSYWGSF